MIVAPFVGPGPRFRLFLKRSAAGWAQVSTAALWMQRWRNSIQVTVFFWTRCVFFRAACFASDKCENIQNRSNTANVPCNTHKSIFHSRMFVGQDFDMFAHTPQPVNFHQKVLERRSDCRPINFRIRGVRWGGGYLCPDVNLKTQILYQPQRCCLAQKRKKKPEQLRYQDDSDFAGLIPVRPGFNLAKTAQATIRHDLHGIESRRFRPCQGQSTRSKSLKAINPHGCTELSAQRLIDAHSCGFGFESGRAGIGFASNKPASQIARFLWRNHWIRSFFKSYGYPGAVHCSQVKVLRFKSS